MSKQKCTNVYTDGSYSLSKEAYVAGVYFPDSAAPLMLKKKPIRAHLQHGSLIAEVEAARLALKYCLKRGLRNLVIHYDCAAIKHVYEIPGHKLQSIPQLREFINTLETCRHEGITVCFEKVTAHGNDVNNNYIHKAVWQRLRAAD